MGERAGYRVREGHNVSPILRKQWFIGDDKKALKNLIINVAKKLLTTKYQRGKPFGMINDGNVALREDLHIGRLTLAMYDVLYDPPFDSMEFDYDCDISDHGLFEIELVRWNVWKLNHYNVRDGLSKPKILLVVKFEPGKPLEDGTRWLTLEEFLASELKGTSG